MPTNKDRRSPSRPRKKSKSLDNQPKPRQKRQSNPDIITVTEITQRLRVSKNTVYRAIEKEIIPAIRLSDHCILIPRKTFEEWFAAGGKVAVSQVVTPDRDEVRNGR